MLCSSLEYEECQCPKHRLHPYIPLTILLLDCWQREYDERPYRHFQITRTFFQKRMHRPFALDDWKVTIEFIALRKPESVRISYITMPAFKDEFLMQSLVESLYPVRSIELKNVDMPKMFLKVFHKNIASMCVKSLDVSENDLPVEHLVELRCILVECATLDSLNVSRCFMNDNTFPILADGIYKSKSLHSVDISRACPMTPISIFESVKFISTVSELIWQNKLTEIHLRKCNLNGHDMESLAEYLSRIESKLVHLDLAVNNIVSYGTEYLFKAFTRSKTLKVLNLSTNNLGDKGGVVIARYLCFTNIRDLDITHNNIGCEALFELLCAIKKPCELKRLKMFGNKFDPNATMVLKRLLRAKVIEQSDIDMTYTFDTSKEELCAIPSIRPGRIHT